MPQDVIGVSFEEFPTIDTLEISNVEVVFIMVNMDKLMEEMPRSLRGQDIERELTSQMKEIEDNFDSHLYRSYNSVVDNLRDAMVCERAGNWPLAKAVTSLHEIAEVVAN